MGLSGVGFSFLKNIKVFAKDFIPLFEFAVFYFTFRGWVFMEGL